MSSNICKNCSRHVDGHERSPDKTYEGEGRGERVPEKRASSGMTCIKTAVTFTSIACIATIMLTWSYGEDYQAQRLKSLSHFPIELGSIMQGRSSSNIATSKQLGGMQTRGTSSSVTQLNAANPALQNGSIKGELMNRNSSNKEATALNPVEAAKSDIEKPPGPFSAESAPNTTSVAAADPSPKRKPWHKIPPDPEEFRKIMSQPTHNESELMDHMHQALEYCYNCKYMTGKSRKIAQVPDRVLLLDKYLPALSSPKVTAVLFVGLRNTFAAAAEHYFRAKNPDLVFVTIEPDASLSVWGAYYYGKDLSFHIPDIAENINNYPHPKFDVVMFHGVLGWGLNGVSGVSKTAIELHRCVVKSFWSCFCNNYII
jgi:hypothetical protein